MKPNDHVFHVFKKPEKMPPNRMMHGVSTQTNHGAVKKHIPGYNNYDNEVKKGNHKSKLSLGLDETQYAINRFAGTGKYYPNSKREVINCGVAIGEWYNAQTGEYLPTTYATIHYGSKGTHLVPAKPEFLRSPEKR